MNYFATKGITPVPFINRHMLSIGPRPSNRLLADLHALGVTDLVTLLSHSEGGEQIGQRAVAHHVSWHWLPMRGADLAQIDPDMLKGRLIALAAGFRAIEEPRRIHVHCSAGIHRTGMVAYGLLRLSGLGPGDACAALARMRAVTAEGMTEDRRRFVDRVLE